MKNNNLRFTAIGGLLLVAILAFEIFNFDTTRFALSHLLGATSFMGVSWAIILAIAFCGIDFAGLLHLFTPDSSQAAPQYVWYMLGAWLCGATLNAVLTWYAVSLTLLQVDAGTIVLSQAQLLQIVPTFIALLVWLIRILFIASLSVMGNALLSLGYTPRYRVVTDDPNQPQIPLRQRAHLRATGREPPLSSDLPARPRMNVRQEE